MRNNILLLILFFGISINAQTNFNSKTLKVTRADLELNVYKKDSTANALVLYEYGNSYIGKYNLDLKTEVKYKIKILNRKGFDKADIIIYLYKNDKKSEKTENIIATTYNIVNNKIIKTELNEKDIFTENYNENYTLVKFTMPNIKVGSVITYSYKLTSPFVYKYKGWEFQSDI